MKQRNLDTGRYIHIADVIIIAFRTFLAGVMIMALVSVKLHDKALRSVKDGYQAKVERAYAAGQQTELLPPPAI